MNGALASVRIIEPARYVRLPHGGLITVGQLAATTTGHPHLPDRHTGSSCLACFGWHDDPRHLPGRSHA